MLAPHRQQSATISHKRIDMGAPQSGHAQASTSPSSQISGEEGPDGGALPNGVEAKSKLES
jgi:hypothetical protein